MIESEFSRADIKNQSVFVRNFSEAYPPIVQYLRKYGHLHNSRSGPTLELLDFKTTMTNPVERCVGGNERKMNIFFLLAEAIWIWAGRNDVKFLNLFNSRMAEFSDNGSTFNAPYGFRLRHHGLDASNTFSAWGREEDGVSYEDCSERNFDQIKWVLNLLKKDPDTRRAVVTIWNPEFDTQDSKDIPCNDLLMFKLRHGYLHLTIANRSNDVHWGLPTNVFQFSFILEMMSNVLGVKPGCQTHNSQSLHLYLENEASGIFVDKPLLYNNNIYSVVKPGVMQFIEIPHIRIPDQLKYKDVFFSNMINELMNPTENWRIHEGLKYWKCVFDILKTYLQYTKTNRKIADKVDTLVQLNNLHKFNIGVCDDYFLLAINWFAAGIDQEFTNEFNLGKNFNIKNSWIGKL